jgi:hypothetical protein
VEDTVLDLIEIADGFDQAYDWICRAIGRRRTTADRLWAGGASRRRAMAGQAPRPLESRP